MLLPLISVALCTYNGEKYIIPQLESILQQSYSNLEVVIVDDHSTDNTWNIILSYKERNPRIKCFRNEENIGFNANFARAISLSNGEYISISDQDDIWVGNKLETLFNNIGEHWLIFSDSAYIDEDGVEINETLFEDFKFVSPVYKNILLQNFVTGHTMLMNRILLDYICPIPHVGYYDWWIGFVAVYHNKASYLDVVLTYYRKHPSSVMQQAALRDIKQHKLNRLDKLITMLGEFAKYTQLKDADHEFIVRLKNALITKRESKLSLALISIIFRHYNVLFSFAKKRKNLKRLNFAFKFAKPM